MYCKIHTTVYDLIKIKHNNTCAFAFLANNCVSMFGDRCEGRFCAIFKVICLSLPASNNDWNTCSPCNKTIS